MLCSLEHRFQGGSLLVQLVQHQLQLGTILGGVVCLALDKGVAAISKVVDFFGTKLCHLGYTAGSQHFLCHVGAWVFQLSSGDGVRQFGQHLLYGFCVDAKQKSIATQSYQRSHCLTLYLYAIGLVLIGHAKGL